MGVCSCVLGQKVFLEGLSHAGLVIESVIVTDICGFNFVQEEEIQFNRCHQVRHGTSAECIQTTVDDSEQPRRNHITWLKEPHHDGRTASNYTVDYVLKTLPSSLTEFCVQWPDCAAKNLLVTCAIHY